ncbi:hypothetical protein BT63DRAFT_192688 [Microthyrium microscopicum]|uniref:Uncharacterized protein n=1 Tax=Microthyrium microscopicum TaxID=703497 RepID=A0A6A6UMG1_9PEZI|nr:hypothetical protein BT63DRAFT_192688 [Microthyrium microscopicum]
MPPKFPYPEDPFNGQKPPWLDPQSGPWPAFFWPPAPLRAPVPFPIAYPAIVPYSGPMWHPSAAMMDSKSTMKLKGRAKQQLESHEQEEDSETEHYDKTPSRQRHHTEARFKVDSSRFHMRQSVVTDIQEIPSSPQSPPRTHTKMLASWNDLKHALTTRNSFGNPYSQFDEYSKTVLIIGLCWLHDQATLLSAEHSSTAHVYRQMKDHCEGTWARYERDLPAIFGECPLGERRQVHDDWEGMSASDLRLRLAETSRKLVQDKKYCRGGGEYPYLGWVS